jgi:predicted acetyltransferase
MSDLVHDTAIDPAATAAYAQQGLRFALLKASDETFEPWLQAVVRGFNSPQVEQSHLPARVDGFAHRRLSAVYDDSIADAATPVASASTWIANLTLPGAHVIPSWAISTVTVAPTHRRRGIARNLIEAELRTAAKLDVPLAILTASEATIYERFGFGPATQRADWTIDTTRAKWTGPIADGRVQLITTEQGRDEGGHEILERALMQVPGELHFDGFLWERLFGLPGGGNPLELRVARYDDAEGVPQGLAIYKLEDSGAHQTGTAQVKYLTSATDDAYSALWRYLLELDLIDVVKAELRSIDEPVRWQISDARAASEDAVHDHLWVRILDVATALEARSYSAPGTFVLEVDDPLGFAAGSWLLAIDDAGRGTVTKLADAENDTNCDDNASDADNPVETFGDNHRLALNVRDLGAIYLGATPISTLVRAGRIAQKTPGAAVAADAAFRSPVAPWLSTWF